MKRTMILGIAVSLAFLSAGGDGILAQDKKNEPPPFVDDVKVEAAIKKGIEYLKKQSTSLRKFEHIGTHPTANRNAITEAVTFHESLGVERKAARFRYLRERWARAVEKLPGVRILNSYDPAQSCALGAMNIETVEAQKLTDYLQKYHRIHVRPRFVPGEYSAIRVTPNVYTTLQEVDTFVAAIEQVVKKGVPASA